MPQYRPHSLPLLRIPRTVCWHWSVILPRCAHDDVIPYSIPFAICNHKVIHQWKSKSKYLPLFLWFLLFSSLFLPHSFGIFVSHISHYCRFGDYYGVVINVLTEFCVLLLLSFSVYYVSYRWQFKYFFLYNILHRSSVAWNLWWKNMENPFMIQNIAPDNRHKLWHKHKCRHTVLFNKELKFSFIWSVPVLSECWVVSSFFLFGFWIPIFSIFFPAIVIILWSKPKPPETPKCKCEMIWST